MLDGDPCKANLTFFRISSNSVMRFSLAEVIGLDDIRFLM